MSPNLEKIQLAIAKSRAEAGPWKPTRDKDPGSYGSRAIDPVGFSEKRGVLALNQHALGTNRIIAWNKRDERTGAFDLLRTKVLRAMGQMGWRTVGVTSPTEACGKTTVSTNLAFSISHQLASNVLLVDLDLRHSRIASYLGFEPEEDLTMFLEGQVPLTTYEVEIGGVRLGIVPNTAIRHNSTELLSGDRADLLFDGLKDWANASVVLFDLPPLLPTDDALAVIPKLDCVLVVVGEDETKKADVSAALSLVPDSVLLGVVYNKSRAKRLTYY